MHVAQGDKQGEHLPAVVTYADGQFSTQLAWYIEYLAAHYIHSVKVHS